MSKFNDAQRITASHVQGTYGYPYPDFMLGLDTVTIKKLHMIVHTGNEEHDRVSAQKEAVKLISHISSLGFGLEQGVTLSKAIDAVREVIGAPDKTAGDLCAAVNDSYVFFDELEQVDGDQDDGGEA